MDPNATLDDLREKVRLIQRFDDTAPPEVLAVCNLFDALDDWLRRGGVPPRDWNHLSVVAAPDAAIALLDPPATPPPTFKVGDAVRFCRQYLTRIGHPANGYKAMAFGYVTAVDTDEVVRVRWDGVYCDATGITDPHPEYARQLEKA